MTINYKFCVVSKVYKIILKKLPADKATKPFYYVYIDLFLKIIIYNNDNYIIYFFNKISQTNKVKIFV